MNSPVRLTLKTSDLDFVNKLFRNKKPERGLKIELFEGGNIELETLKIRPGISGAEIIITILATVIADLITDLLKELLNDDKNQLEITHTKKIIKHGDETILIEEIKKIHSPENDDTTEP